MADRRPVIKGPDDAWKRLGELLQLRRGELGYRRRPAFTRDRGINIRLVTDIENAYRPNTFLTPTLREIAEAYAVTYDSIVAVVLGHDDELIPAETVIRHPRRVTESLPPSPFDPDRTEADRPYVLGIWDRYLDLPRRVAEPSGEQMFPGSPDDARAWDSITAAYGIPAEDLVWVIADLRRRAAGRAGTPAANSHGA
jgi:hypothetical protein